MNNEQDCVVHVDTVVYDKFDELFDVLGVEKIPKGALINDSLDYIDAAINKARELNDKNNS